MKRNELIVRFGIWNFDDISHQEISRCLDASPARIYVKGQKKSSVSSQLVTENGWLYESPLGKYASFEDQINSILDLLESKIEILKQLSEKYYCEISCASFIYNNDESTPWVHLNSRYNSLLKELKIEFDLDLYVLLPSDVG